MIVSLRKVMERGKFVILFIVLTFLLYHAFGIISAWIQPVERYREPKGRAVKVFQNGGFSENGSMADRLKLFYWYGE